MLFRSTNVVEDSRIERKIKNKYPGLRASFVKAYKELLEKDFFGTQGVDLNTMPFLDRMNLFCKGGPAQGIQFSPFERNLVDMVETTETYDDVIRVSKLVAQYAKEEKEEKRQRMLEEGVEDDEEFEDDYEEGDDGEFDYDQDFDDEEGESKEEGDDVNQGGDSDEEDEDDTKDQKSPSGTSGGHQGENDETEIRSLTDENYKKNESKLFAKDDGAYTYGNVPDVDLNKAILDYKKVFAQYKESTKHIPLRTETFQKFRKETAKVVSYMVKEFELRKNADQMKRASIAKTDRKSTRLNSSHT